MQILKGDFSNVKGIPPSGLCVGVHRAGAVHQKMSQSTATIWRFGRSDRILISLLSKKKVWENRGFVPPTIWNL